MRLKNKNIYVYTLYLIITILISLIIYYSYKILNKKIERYDNQINYLDKNYVIDYLYNDYDNYVNSLSNFDLIARKVNSNDEYKEKISKCAKDFSENQKHIITNCCNKADNFLNNYNDLLDGKEIAKTKWKFALTDKNQTNEYENGLPHTRGDIIFLSEKMLPETITDDLVNTLIHEKIHIYQRNNKSLIDNVLANKLNITKITYYNPKKRANPDLNSDFYVNEKNEILQCYYNSDNPNSIQDVSCLHNNNLYEHPYEYLAYEIANKYNENLIKKYINI
jgi:hypothetical protein